MPRELSLAEIFQVGYYWETKILLTAVKLDVFSALAGKQRTVAELAQRIGADERALTLVMNALVAMRVLSKDADRFNNTEVARTHLVKGSAQYVGHLLLLHDAEWNHWGSLEETIRTGRSPVSRHVFEADPELGAHVLSVLHRIGQQSGPALAQRLELGHAKTLLDLGGGAGTNAIAFCTTYPDMRATVFDLPQTLTVAERTVKEAGLESRITLMPGDFNADPLGGPYDVVLMSDILHYQDADANAALVRKAFAHVTAGGRLVIKDRFLDPSGTSPAWTSAFAVHILVNTARGRCYTVSEARHWMEQAGFELVEELEQTAVIQGSKRV
ncbi:acetylserotonin O-methyltransferase [Nitrospiraceae bacterium AH_259_D15_M11_P09]|nr:acetylserotonin O-methyltransferase [Nitrospiraceae bacterium AH_259_D15_M11_P09]